VLREEARAGGEPLRLAVDFDACADGVAVRFRAAELEREGGASFGGIVLEGANLRAEAAFEDEVGIAVAIEVGDREGASVVGEVEPADAEASR